MYDEVIIRRHNVHHDILAIHYNFSKPLTLEQAEVLLQSIISNYDVSLESIPNIGDGYRAYFQVETEYVLNMLLIVFKLMKEET